MEGWGWIGEAKLREKGEPGEQQILAGEGNEVPGKGRCCSLGGFWSPWPPLCLPPTCDPTSPISPNPDLFPQYHHSLNWGQEGGKKKGRREKRKWKWGGAQCKEI